MKQRLDEEKLKTKSEQDSKIVTENELRDKKLALETEQSRVSELNRKVKAGQTRAEELESANSEDSTRSSKAKSNVSQLQSKKN